MIESLTQWIVSNEAVARLSFFLAIFFVMALWELVLPKRPQRFGRIKRWPANLGIIIIDAIAVRLLVPILPAAFALVCQQNGWGLFNLYPVPVWLNVIGTIIIFDVIIYFQHVMFHAVPLLWRFHSMHHADNDLDVTSGNRFHPVEILLSIGIKLMAVFLIGPLPIGVILFEIILNGLAQFNHSNIRLPKFVDVILRMLIVTPDMHRVHHSVIHRETDSNFGFNISAWDRIFGTYRAQPEKGHDGMTIGLNEYQDEKYQKINWLLFIPFLKPKEKN